MEICPTCTFTLLENLTLSNERRGPSPLVDFFVGKPGSVLELNGVYRHRLACTSSREAGETLELLPRSKLLPKPNGTQQIRFLDAQWRVSVLCALGEAAVVVLVNIPDGGMGD